MSGRRLVYHRILCSTISCQITVQWCLQHLRVVYTVSSKCDFAMVGSWCLQGSIGGLVTGLSHRGAFHFWIKTIWFLWGVATWFDWSSTLSSLREDAAQDYLFIYGFLMLASHNAYLIKTPWYEVTWHDTFCLALSLMWDNPILKNHLTFSAATIAVCTCSLDRWMTYCVLWLTWLNNNPLIIAQDVMPPCKDRAQLLHASPTQGDLLAGQNISHSMSNLDILYLCAVDPWNCYNSLSNDVSRVRRKLSTRLAGSLLKLPASSSVGLTLGRPTANPACPYCHL